MRNFIVILTTLLIIGYSGILDATSAMPPTIEDLVHASDEIVNAEVKKIKSRFESVQDDDVKATLGGKDQIIVSEITLNILKSYKGNAQEQITVKQPGGCVLDKCLTISLYPNFRAGETAIFFLTHDGTSDLHILMGEYGILKIDNSGTVIRLGVSQKTLEDHLEDVRKMTQGL